MAATISTVSSTAAKLASTQNGIHTPASSVLLPLNRSKHGTRKSHGHVVCQAASVSADRVPDMGKRQLMNTLLLGAISLPTIGILGPYLYFFVPPGSGGSGTGLIAKDAIGNDITVKEWLETHPPGDRTLCQGLKGDPTYLVVENDGTLAPYAINGVCTHLGCVVPWNKAENKFICPCHGSQYNNQGKVVRGPAPLSLALAHCDLDGSKIILNVWPETDFRTGENPWWA